MNAIQLLKDEHEKAKRVFRDIRAASTDQRAQLWATLEPKFQLHEEMEEAALYGPVAQELGSRDQTLMEWKERHHEEVTEAEALMAGIRRLDPTTEQWMARVNELNETLERHMEKEEGSIWPRIEQAWSRTKLELAGQQMEILKWQKMPRAVRQRVDSVGPSRVPAATRQVARPASCFTLRWFCRCA